MFGGIVIFVTRRLRFPVCHRSPSTSAPVYLNDSAPGIDRITGKYLPLRAATDFTSRIAASRPSAGVAGPWLPVREPGGSLGGGRHESCR
jgi:hypothetical protein